MGLSAVLFDLQGKIDADQLQAAQVGSDLYRYARSMPCENVLEPLNEPLHCFTK